MSGKSKKEDWLNHLAFEIERVKAYASELVQYFQNEAIREQTLAFYAEREAIEQERARKRNDNSSLREVTPLQRAKELVKQPVDAWLSTIDDAMSSTRETVREAVQETMQRLNIATKHQPIIAEASEHAMQARQLVPNLLRMLPTPQPTASGKKRFEAPAPLSKDDLKDIHIDFHQDLRDKHSSFCDTLNDLLHQTQARPAVDANNLLREILMPRAAAYAHTMGMARHMTRRASTWPEPEQHALFTDASRLMRDVTLNRALEQALAQSPLLDLFSRARPTFDNMDNPHAYFQAGNPLDYMSGPKPSSGPIIEEFDESTGQFHRI